MSKINNISPDRNNFLQIASTIANAPKSLCYVGSLPDQRLPTVAIVGTRRPTAYGQEIAYKLAYELASQGVVIVSGLALGIDAIAHRGALDAGGITLAVQPGGLDRVYPYSHRQLAIRIVQNRGALISERPAGENVQKFSFVVRNRLVSGISDGLLVVEATAKSGTMHTVNFALEQGRAVMAVPGNITSPASAGCNNLIRTGATPVTCTDDVLQAIGYTATAPKQLPLAANQEEQTILDLISQGLRDGDEIMAGSSLTPAQFSQTLTMLEITGKISALGGNQWSIK